MDPAETQNHYVDPASGRLQVASGSPGFGGAILDLLKSLVGATAPRSVTQRPGQIAQAVEQAAPVDSSLGRQFD